MSLSIRDAVAADAEGIARIGRHLHDESPTHVVYPYSEERVAEFMRTLVARTDALVLVAVTGTGEIVGGIAAMVLGSHWSWPTNYTHAGECSFFLLPEHRGSPTAARLIKRMTQWGKDKGCIRLTAGTGTRINTDRVIRLYEALGWSRCGHLVDINLGE